MICLIRKSHIFFHFAFAPVKLTCHAPNPVVILARGEGAVAALDFDKNETEWHEGRLMKEACSSPSRLPSGTSPQHQAHLGGRDPGIYGEESKDRGVRGWGGGGGVGKGGERRGDEGTCDKPASGTPERLTLCLN